MFMAVDPCTKENGGLQVTMFCFVLFIGSIKFIVEQINVIITLTLFHSLK